MSSLILDSSATLAWIYGDETTEAIRRVFDAIADNGAIVPALWRLEVANSLTMAVRKRRIDPDFRRAALADLALLDITTDPQIDSYAWTDTLNLADQFRLLTRCLSNSEVRQNALDFGAHTHPSGSRQAIDFVNLLKLAWQSLPLRPCLMF